MGQMKNLAIELANLEAAAGPGARVELIQRYAVALVVRFPEDTNDEVLVHVRRALAHDLAGTGLGVIVCRGEGIQFEAVMPDPSKE
jgi:hypothetical protein